MREREWERERERESERERFIPTLIYDLQKKKKGEGEKREK